jgi:hypothetical protein
MFRTVPLSIIRSFSLYTQQWYMSHRFVGSIWAGSGWNCISILILRLLIETRRFSSPQHPIESKDWDAPYLWRNGLHPEDKTNESGHSPPASVGVKICVQLHFGNPYFLVSRTWKLYPVNITFYLPTINKHFCNVITFQLRRFLAYVYAIFSGAFTIFRDTSKWHKRLLRLKSQFLNIIHSLYYELKSLHWWMLKYLKDKNY